MNDNKLLEFKIEDAYGQVRTIVITPLPDSPMLRVLREMEEERDRLRQKLAYYEAPLPLGKGNCYHRFTDEGLCIRCGEDAEEWDAGCVEEIVEELQSITTREFLAALQKITQDRYGGPIDVLLIYMGKIEKSLHRWEHYFGEVEAADGKDEGVDADLGI